MPDHATADRPDTLAGRIAAGGILADAIQRVRPDMVVDLNGRGVAFARSGGGASQNFRLVHELHGIPLCSRFTLPVTHAFGTLPWHVVWQCLQSAGWVKMIPDKAHALELVRFGCPNVVHLPLSVSEISGDAIDCHLPNQQPTISFVGDPAGPTFAAQSPPPAGSMIPAVLAQAVQCDSPQASFHDIFFNLYRLGQPVSAEHDAARRLGIVTEYFKTKLQYQYACSIRSRDRYVLFLSKALPQAFRLFGAGWNAAYGLKEHVSPDAGPARARHYRQNAINLVLPDGSAETGLNAAHFEIAAAGGFMLCRDHPELPELFDVERECAVFRTEADLLRKIEYYLNHPDERMAIAAAGRKRVSLDHLDVHRLKALVRCLQPRKHSFTFAATDAWDDIRTHLHDPDVLLDCGAHAGSTAVQLRKLFPGATIYSFEPVSDTYARLCETCQPIGVRAVPCAVGDENGSAWINLTAGDQSNSMLEYEPGNPCARWTREIGRERIRVRRLDDWCNDEGIDVSRVDLLKLDVQGAELAALRGAPRLLRAVRLVYLEVCFETIYKDLPLFEEIDRFLQGCGFRRLAVYPSDQPHNWGDALYLNVRPALEPQRRDANADVLSVPG
ncbi:MAG: FkbM family methyltransferase [Phycisphaerales bacterium]|nr:FkbM family methyltransferase [Phycisphaerales bacterium]